MSNLLSVILVAVLGVVGNIVYFEYSGRKQKDRENEKQLLVNLLLPLYCSLKVDEWEFISCVHSENGDPYEFEADKPVRLLNDLADVIKANLYLADDAVHTACMSFMRWAYTGDTDERFQRLYRGQTGEDKEFVEFRRTIYQLYEQEKRKYLS